MNTTVSVIIPCFNAEKYLAATITSVLAQSIKVDEIIVIDDGSTDATESIARSFSEVRYFHHKNNGVSFSRNRGLKESTGDLVVFLDSDDLLPLDRVQFDLEAFKKTPGLGYVFGWFNVINENGESVPFGIKNELQQVGYDTVLEGKVLVSPGAVTFKKSFLERLDYVFDEKLHVAEDFDLYLRFSRQFPIFCHNKISLLYRKHESNLSSANGAVKTLNSLLTLLNREKDIVRTDSKLMKSLKEGKAHWKTKFCPRCVDEFVCCLKKREVLNAIKIILFASSVFPLGFVKNLNIKIISFVNKRIANT